jgi:hypothetical protein
MAELNPLGSEKLNGDDKLKRILELTYYNSNKKSSSTPKPELVKESTIGGVYCIVKEKDGYYVKRGLNESSLDYIGGMFMKNKNKFSSYAEASKRLNLIQGQDELQEATKYILKPNAPKSEAPAPDPTLDAAPAPAPADAPSDGGMGDDAPTDAAVEAPPTDGGMGDTPPTDDGMGDSSDESAESKRSDYMSEIQKYAGKLGQELRDQHQKMESDDIKYVLNMIISACDLDKLDIEDLEEIGKKFERDEEGQEGGEDTGSEEPASEPSAEPASEPSAEPTSSSDQEMGENMDALERFVNGPAPMDEVSLSGYMNNNESLDGQKDEEKEIDLEEMKNEINNHIHSTLKKYFN